MKKVYLAGGISDTARKNYQKELATLIRDLNALKEEQLYAASENDSINDKSKQAVTPGMIYDGDIPKVLESDTFIATITGGNEDGTLSEIGAVAGANEERVYYNDVIQQALELMLEGKYIEAEDLLENAQKNTIKMIGFSTNERILHPDSSQGIYSASFNQLVLAMIQRWGEFAGSEQDMLDKLKDLRSD